VPDEEPAAEGPVLNHGILGRSIVPREGSDGSPVPTGVPALMLCSECGRVRPATKFPTTDPAHRDTECRDCRDDRRMANLPPGEIIRPPTDRNQG
jgi:hypothetical protein